MRSLWFVVSGLVLALFARSASADDAGVCPAFPQVHDPYLVAPVDGASDVPLDAVLRLQWPGGALDANNGPPSHFALVADADGTVVATTKVIGDAWGTGDVQTVVVRLTPTAPLAPHTTYRVQYGYGDNVPLGDVGTFDTGTSSGGDAPAAPTLATLSLEPAAACGFEEHQCCVPTTVVDATIIPGPASTSMRYDVRVGAQLLGADLAAPLAGMLVCDDVVPGFSLTPDVHHPARWIATASTTEVVVIARDLAGRESAPLAVPLAPDCTLAPGPPDAGPGGGADAGPNAGADSGCGCHVAGRGGSGSGSGTAGGGLVVLLGLVTRVHRRRRAGV